MFRIGLISILIAAASVFQAKSIELLANRKLWKSVSDQLAYYFSGNQRHGRLFNNFVFTDRGISPLYPSDKYAMNLMNYGFLSLDEYTVTIWMLNFGLEYSDMNIVVYNGSESYVIYYIFNFDATILSMQSRVGIDIIY